MHALRGKEFVEYDNPYDVGMTGLLGFASGYRAMEHCDALLMLGTDFPYRPFYPDDATVIQVDIRGEQTRPAHAASTSGSSAPSGTPLAALLPLLARRRDATHLDAMLDALRSDPQDARRPRRADRDSAPDPSAVRRAR